MLPVSDLQALNFSMVVYIDLAIVRRISPEAWWATATI